MTNFFDSALHSRQPPSGRRFPAVLREAELSPNYLKDNRPRGRRLDTLAAAMAVRSTGRSTS